MKYESRNMKTVTLHLDEAELVQFHQIFSICNALAQTAKVPAEYENLCELAERLQGKPVLKLAALTGSLLENRESKVWAEVPLL